VTSSILGPAPIVDFDGTVTVLPVDWDGIRARYQVDRMVQLWDVDSPDVWSVVRDAEVEAARQATPLAAVRRLLESSSEFAVLTSNSEDAVASFLERFPTLEWRMVLVVGRETLAGPKGDYEVFRRGFTRCVAATEAARAEGRVVYAGDADWELEFARKLGAEAVDARTLTAEP
jgi:phosphoglycolate phosphatase-like HAD superfamily hydrolase